MKIKKDFILAFTISLIAVILDQISKLFILKYKVLLPMKVSSLDIFNIVYVENKGVSFGMLSEYNITFGWVYCLLR